jgi:hypothetical protein
MEKSLYIEQDANDKSIWQQWQIEDEAEMSQTRSGQKKRKKSPPKKESKRK